MKKLILFIILFVTLKVSAQQTYWTPGVPPSSTSFTPSFRFKAGASDSLNNLYVSNGNKWYQVYTAAQANARFTGGGGGIYLPLTLTLNTTVSLAGHTLGFDADMQINGVNIGRGGNGTQTANTVLGAYALENTVGVGLGGYQNTAIGTFALQATTTGPNNTALGYNTLSANTTGQNNTALGSYIMPTSTSSDNTGIGYASLSSLTSGGNNTAVGSIAGGSVSTGSGNVFLGYEAGIFETGSNTLYISNSSTATPLIKGNFSTPSVTINGAFNATGSINGINFTTGGGSTTFLNANGTYSTPSGGVAWGAITGTLSAQTDLNTALNGKQASLVSGTNIKSINSTSLLGSGNIVTPNMGNTDLTVSANRTISLGSNSLSFYGTGFNPGFVIAPTFVGSSIFDGSQYTTNIQSDNAGNIYFYTNDGALGGGYTGLKFGLGGMNVGDDIGSNGLIYTKHMNYAGLQQIPDVQMVDSLITAAGGSGVTAVTGTASRITSTGGATPAIDISASYAGQSSIVNVGTLVSGVIDFGLLSGTPPTWNQNTTGTASNITATSNSTLTTLSALSLPYSQLTGAPSLASYLTAIGVTTANGVSGTSSGGTTPNLTIVLGAITPTSTNGVSAATMAFNDATSSIQTQLNGKQASGSYALQSTTVAGFPLSSNVTLGTLTPGSSLTNTSGSNYNGTAGTTLDINLANGNTFTAAQIVSRASTGTSILAGWAGSYGTAATLGSPQNSPSAQLVASAIATTPGTAMDVKFDTYIIPVQGASAPTGTWVLRSSINGSNINQLQMGTNGNLTVNANLIASSGLFSSNAQAKHFIGSTTAPTIAAGTGAGTSPTVSVTGTDASGILSVTTGTTPTGTNAIIGTITFNTAYSAAPRVVIVAGNRNTQGLGITSEALVPVAGETNGVTTTTFVLESGTVALTAATNYKWAYQVIQ